MCHTKDGLKDSGMSIQVVLVWIKIYNTMIYYPHKAVLNISLIMTLMTLTMEAVLTFMEECKTINDLTVYQGKVFSLLYKRTWQCCVSVSGICSCLTQYCAVAVIFEWWFHESLTNHLNIYSTLILSWMKHITSSNMDYICTQNNIPKQTVPVLYIQYLH